MSGAIFEARNPIVALGPAGFTQRLPGGLATPATQFDWQTEGELPVELEVRIQVKELGGLNTRTLPQQLRYQIVTYGHGGASFEPAPWQFASGAGAGAAATQRVPNWPIPARGVCVRLSARRLTIMTKCFAANTEPLIQLSVMPVGSAQLTPWPNVEMGFPADPLGLSTFPQGDLGMFPPDANEWRLDGWRFVSTVLGWTQLDPMWPVNYFCFAPPSGAGGSSLGQTIAGDLFDWQPIPIAAQSWQLARDLAGTPIIAGALYR